MRKTKDLFEFKNIPLNVHTKLLICPFFVMISSHSLISLTAYPKPQNHKL